MPAPEDYVRQETSSQSFPFYDLIESDLSQVQQRIAGLLQSPDESIHAVLQTLKTQTGKMLRPALVLLSGLSVGSLVPDHIDLAAMVELVHRGSLLHDDVMDSADTRRSQPTANALWGNSAAVLLGDFLLSKAFAMGTTVQCAGAAGILTDAAQQLCSGELMQNFQKGQWDITEQQYYQIIEAKTAVLFRSSCRLGATASQAPDEQIEGLDQFGLGLGIAFQITDDLLDLLATDQQAGKTLGTDLAQGKLTLPLIHWIHSGDSQQCMDMLAQPTKTAEILKQIRQSGSIDYAFGQVQARIDQAKSSLDILPDTPAKNALNALAEYVASRLQ
ncbi:MAG: polyprenyl synthetase family protein [Planctomycetota bacterium]|jgi:octaprenyl-diphosphate synthase